jgi:hypothetical protein
MTSKKWIILGIVVMASLLLVATVVAGPAAQSSEAEGANQRLAADAPAGSLDIAVASPVSTSFTYQGQLKDGGEPVNDTCNLQFRLYDQATGGAQVGSLINATVPISDGLFTVSLDFGSAVFAGDARWLEIAVQCPGDAGFATLSPRQALTAAPYAIYALTAPWSGLAGVPAGFADGVDNNTTYSAGTGLSLAGTQFSLGTTYRLPQSCGNGQIAEWNGSTWACGNDDIGASGSFWSLTGNSSTNPATHFLGTTDGVSLTLAVSGTAALRLVPNEVSPNLIGGYIGNSVAPGVVGATIGGGGSSSEINQVSGDYATISGGYQNTTSAWATTVGGGYQNTASTWAATASGGWGNTASGGGATVAGGQNNTAGEGYATVGGGLDNIVSGWGATVAGGNAGDAEGTSATIGGGYHNTATYTGTTVAGGQYNTAGGENATVGGGYMNHADALTATVGGGEHISVTGEAATVAGGAWITVTGHYAAVGGGYQNTASAWATTVGGGRDNTASEWYATIGGGLNNTASSICATIGGGSDNTASGDGTTVGGGMGNTANGNGTTVDGGNDNTANGEYVTVGGGEHISVIGQAATVAGGSWITVTGNYAAIGGGWKNTASGFGATVGGGMSNTANGNGTTIDGGNDNTASGDGTTVGGGMGNTANGEYVTVGGGEYINVTGRAATVAGGSWITVTGDYAAVGGGQYNVVTATHATVGGGYYNTASGNYAAIPGGNNNTADGAYSFAAGRRAKANHDGAFVWGDSTDADVTSTATDSFVVRASGGVTMCTNSSLTSGMYLSSGGSSWNAVSDRARKENFAPVDTQALLAQLAEMPISTWNYKSQDPAIRHIGPMAQDFNALLDDLGGEGETYINTLDADGVALAAIQGLYAQNQELEQQNADLEARVAALEAALANGAAPAAQVSQSNLLPWAGVLLAGAGLVWAFRRRAGLTLFDGGGR